MKTKTLLLTSSVVAALALIESIGRQPGERGSIINLFCPSCSAADESPVDYGKAQEIFKKRQAGEALTVEENAYLQRAMQAKQKEKANPWDKATPVSDPKIVAALVPLDELKGNYKGEDGGLYGGGRNTPPDAHFAAYLKESAKIKPLDSEGKPSDDGKIVLLSLGMSNTTMEYSEFVKLADADPKKSSKVVVVDGAKGARTTTAWALDDLSVLPTGEEERLLKILPPGANNKRVHGDTWLHAETRLKEKGVTPQQVQAMWIKQAEANPERIGQFPIHARALETNLVDVLNIAKHHYPNLRVVYLSSRIFAGYATSKLNPEPFAYEGAFAMRWVIQDQIRGDSRLNYNPTKGAVQSPIVVWGPYLWANGTTPRKGDGLVWDPEDFVTTDHTHPSETAKAKVAGLLQKFFESDPGASKWFVK